MFTGDTKAAYEKLQAHVETVLGPDGVDDGTLDLLRAEIEDLVSRVELTSSRVELTSSQHEFLNGLLNVVAVFQRMLPKIREGNRQIARASAAIQKESN